MKVIYTLYNTRCSLVTDSPPYVSKYSLVVQSVPSVAQICVLLFRPVQSTVEEASVYDIKDHMDYKFRPGRVVVRVGGYEVRHKHLN